MEELAETLVQYFTHSLICLSFEWKTNGAHAWQRDDNECPGSFWPENMSWRPGQQESFWSPDSLGWSVSPTSHGDDSIVMNKNSHIWLKEEMQIKAQVYIKLRLSLIFSAFTGVIAGDVLMARACQAYSGGYFCWGKSFVVGFLHDIWLGLGRHRVFSGINDHSTDVEKRLVFSSTDNSV